MIVYGADILGEAVLERCSELGQVQVPVDAAELVIGFEHPGGAPAERHGPVAPVLDVAGVIPADPDHRLDAVGGAQRAGQGRLASFSNDAPPPGIDPT